MIFYDIKDAFKSYFIDKNFEFYGFNSTYKSIELVYVNKNLDGMPLYEDLLTRSVILTFSFSSSCIFVKAKVPSRHHSEYKFSVPRSDPYVRMCEIVQGACYKFFVDYGMEAEKSIEKAIIQQEINNLNLFSSRKNDFQTDYSLFLGDGNIEAHFYHHMYELKPNGKNLFKIQSINKKIKEVHSIMETMEYGEKDEYQK